MLWTSVWTVMFLVPLVRSNRAHTYVGDPREGRLVPYYPDGNPRHLEQIAAEDWASQHSSLVDRMRNSTAYTSFVAPQAIYNASRDNSCIEQWSDYFWDQDIYSGPHSWTTTFERMAFTDIYETIKTIGNGSTSIDCDGITRWHFGSGNRTTVKSSFSVVYKNVQIPVKRCFTDGTVTYAIGDEQPAMQTKGCEVLTEQVRPHGGPLYRDYTPTITDPYCTIGRTKMNVAERSTFCDKKMRSYYATRVQSFRPYQSPRPEEPNFNPHTNAMNQVCPEQSICNLDLKDEVVLIYWPANPTNTRNICNVDDMENQGRPSNSTTALPRTFTTTAITFQGQDLYLREWRTKTEYRVRNTDFYTTWRGMTAPGTYSSNFSPVPAKLRTLGKDQEDYDFVVTEDDIGAMPKYVTPSVLYGNFTFVSPTLYIAHHAITARNVPLENAETEAEWVTHRVWESEVRKAGVFPVQLSDVYSWKPKPLNGGLPSVQLIAKGKLSYTLNPLFAPGDMVPVNVNNLPNPVPAGVYFDARPDCWGRQSHCSIITDDSYRPFLSIKKDIWLSYLPEHRNCELPMLFDPPLGLSDAASIAKPVIHPAKPVAIDEPEKTPTVAWDPEPLLAVPGAGIPVPQPKQTFAPGREPGFTGPRTKDQFEEDTNNRGYRGTTSGWSQIKDEYEEDRSDMGHRGASHGWLWSGWHRGGGPRHGGDSANRDQAQGPPKNSQDVDYNIGNIAGQNGRPHAHGPGKLGYDKDPANRIGIAPGSDGSFWDKSKVGEPVGGSPMEFTGDSSMVVPPVVMLLLITILIL